MRRIYTFLLTLMFFTSVARAESFDEFEIRVITPRYFVKRQRFELGTQGLAITNQTFTYTYLASLMMAYHITETWGIRLSGAYGISIDKNDRNELQNDFEIKTQIMPTQQIYTGELMWTPIYGKYQLRSGRLVYFDTFLSAGAGSTTIAYTYDHCTLPRDYDGKIVGDRRAAMTKAYTTYTGGVGQRFFLDDSNALNWDIKTQFFSTNTDDAACYAPESTEKSATSLNYNLTVQFGYSKFL